MELKEIFRSPKIKAQPESFAKAQPSAFKPSRHAGELQKSGSQLTYLRQQKVSGINIDLAKDAKRSITRRLVREEVQWFEKQSVKEIALKVSIMALLILVGYFYHLLAFELTLSSIITSFFLFTTNKRFYRNQRLYKWGKASFFLTALVFSNCLLGSFVTLRKGQFVASLYLNIFFILIYFYRPAIKTRNCRTLIESLFSLGRSFLEVFMNLFRLRAVLLFALGLVFFINSIIGAIGISAISSQTFTFAFIKGFLLSFLFGICLLHLLIWFEEIPILTFEKRINNTHAIITLLKLNPQVENNRQIHLRCLDWVVDFTQWNENAMKAYPYHSKFYSTYWDVFKDYAEQQLAQSNSSLIILREKIEYLNLLLSKNKTMKDDLFIWGRVLFAIFQVHKQSLDSLKCLGMTDVILEIYCSVQKQRNVLPLEIKNLKQKTQQFYKNERLLEVVRNKMREYLNKVKYAVNYFEK